jgi:hypothetical protein
MQPRKFRILYAITAGSLALAVVAITASSGTSQTATHAAFAARTGSFLLVNSAGTPPGQLNPGQRITSGTQIASPDGKFVLQMQSDGNLVLRAPGNIPLGDTRTAGHNGAIAVMQTDGNFVLRAPGNIPVWASGTDGHPGTVLQVQDDGAVVLYAPGHQVLRVIFPASPGPRGNVPTPAVPPVTVPVPAPSSPAPPGASGTTPGSSTPLTPFQICEAQGPGLISDGHGGCTPDGAVSLGKPPSECAKEIIGDKAGELAAEAIIKKIWKKEVQTGSTGADVGKVVKCILWDMPGS